MEAKHIAVIGAGISGITAANILQKNGHQVTVYEKSDKIGGVWALAYPEVRLQNSYQQYHMGDFDWPFQPDLHPTAAQILRYMEEAIVALKIDVRLSHEIQQMKATPDGWTLHIHHDGTTTETHFDYVIVSVGQYTEGKYIPSLPGQERFSGAVVSERDIKDLAAFDGQRVVVVGFGKSALDMATFAAKHGAQVHHVFRAARWTIPRHIFGIHYTRPLFGRFSSVMMTSWAHPTRFERFLHKRLPFVVNGFWRMLEGVFSLQMRGKGEDARARLRVVRPKHRLINDLRSAVALAPDDYYALVAEGKIQPYEGQIGEFTADGVRLTDSREIVCDKVILSLGSKSPTFPFLPQEYRDLLEGEPDGTQLYRHLIHPRIPNLAFAGFNHGFMHIPAVEIGTLWLCALIDGRLQLPPVAQMEQTIDAIQAWKREHIHFEPSRACAINTRFQQYLDIMLKDLGLSPYRKSPNIIAELFARYGASDYRTVLTDYQRKHVGQPQPRQPLPLDT